MVEELTPPATDLPDTHRAPAKVLSILAGAALVIVALIFVGYFIVYAAYARSLLAFPFDYDQGEGFELYDAIRLARGEGIYLDNTQFPFYSSNYPPVYRLMLVPLIWLFGPHLWVGRIVALACSLVIGVLIFIAARRSWRLEIRDWGLGRIANLQLLISILIPLIAALSFFAANFVYHIGPLARAHLPMVMFAFAGILCLDIAFRNKSQEFRTKTQDDAAAIVMRQRWCVIAGIALLLIAGFTKLQAVDALVAGFGYLLIRKPKWFAIAFVVSLIVTGIIVLVMNLSTAGQFWLNVVAANVNEYDINLTWQTYGQWFQLQGVLIVCSVIYVIWDIVAAIRARSFEPITVWSMYFVAGAALGMLTGKWGAGPAYLIAAIAASAVCTVGLFGRLSKWVIDKWGNAHHDYQSTQTQLPIANYLSMIALMFASAFLVQASLNIHLPTSGRLFGPVAQALGVSNLPSSYPPYPYYDSIGYTQLGHWVLPEDEANGWALVEKLRAVEGPVWSEEAMLTLLAGKDVVTNPTQLLNLSKNDALDTTKMIEMIRRREFGAVVFRAMFYPEDVKQAIVENYYWAQKFTMNGFEYWLLLPGQ
jgi:4-amino-4-deoxy-L-arabinose transferase-like glycosyltransferase